MADTADMVHIEGDEIVIRVPIAAIPHAAMIAFDDAYGEHDCRVSDPKVAAESIVRALQDEEEDGTTPVHVMLDKAVIHAFEQGDDGFEGGE